ncbi:hypothetical protein GIB67_026402, partial [Kingdonia uniflora]
MSIRDAMRTPICSNYGGPVMLGEISLEKQQLRVENVRLQDELNRVCTLAKKLLGRPVSSLATSISSHMPNSGLELTVGCNGLTGLSTMITSLPLGMKPNEFVTETTRETVIINSLALVEILLDANRWAKMFPCVIARTSTAKVIFWWCRWNEKWCTSSGNFLY